MRPMREPAPDFVERRGPRPSPALLSRQFSGLANLHNKHEDGHRRCQHGGSASDQRLPMIDHLPEAGRDNIGGHNDPLDGLC